MNYSNLPVYIRKEDSSNALPFANIYDPSGVDNSLYITNLKPEILVIVLVLLQLLLFLISLVSND